MSRFAAVSFVFSGAFMSFKIITTACLASAVCLMQAQAQAQATAPAAKLAKLAEGSHAVSASLEGPSTAASAPPTQRWEVLASDVTLVKTLERWSASAGHKLRWDAARNFLIGAPDVYIGTFDGALQHVLRSPGIRYSDYPLEACVYANSPPLVRITRLGEQSRECAATSP